MSKSLTSRLKLVKPNPGTAEPVNVAEQINASFDKIDEAIAPADVTSTTRPTSPFPNQMIRESDTRRVYLWNDTSGTWDQLVVVGPAQTLLPVEIERSATSSSAFVAKVSGDTTVRYLVFADGKIEWGPGNAARDTNLYRVSANALGTDDAFRVAGDFVAGGNEGVNAAAVTSGADTVTSASYVNLAGTGSQTSFSIVKRFPAAQTRLKVHMSANMWVSGTFPTAVTFGVNVNGTDTTLFRHQIDSASANNVFGQGTGYISGLAAGSYTVQGRWRRVTGTGTPQRDAGNWLTIMVEEVSV